MPKILVAYFSPEGHTKKIAERLAQAVGADLHEIVPEQPYTEADLNWHDQNSRTTKENVDRTSRPAIAARSRVEDPAAYDVVFIGFPIWWYREPAIIDTFVEQYGFAGKKVVPFATSGSSGIGKSGENIQKLIPEAKVDSGLRFDTRVSVEDLKNWAAAHI